MSYNEYLATGQNNYTFPQTFNASGRFPIIAKSVWETLADAQGYVDDYAGSNAHVGQVISVIGDEDNNGLYLVSTIATAEGETGILTKIGGGTGSVSVEYYYNALELATSDNLGQIIYVTDDWVDTDGSYGEEGEEYDAGPYIVTGAGSVAKLGTTSASGDLDSSVTTLEGKVSTLESSVSTLQTDLSEIDSDLTDLETTVGELALGDTNVIESITVNGDAVTISDKTAAITFTDTNTTYTIVKLSDAESGNASSYQLQDSDGEVVGATINIPLDQVLSSAEIKTVETVDTPYTGSVVGDKYIEFQFQNSDTQYLPVQDLVDVYEGSTYITISDSNVISLDYSGLKTQLTTDLDVVKSVDTTVSSGLGLSYSGNEVSLAVDLTTLTSAVLDGVETTDTTYDVAEDGNLTLSEDNEFAVDVASLTVSLVSDETEGGVGESLSALATRVTELEGVEVVIPTYTAADDTIVVTADGDNFTLKVDVTKVNTDTTYSALSNGNLTLSEDNEFSVDVETLTVALVSDETEGGVGTILATKADADDLETLEGSVETLEGSVETLSSTVETLSEAMTWGSIVEEVEETE